MGKSWKNPLMAANAAKKGAKFTKLAREIQVAAKLGGPDPNNNSRLRMAVDAAREEQCPKDTIERAIKKGAGLLDGAAAIEEAVYEGYAPHRVGVIVECQTDNKNRTASEIRNLFNKSGGELSAVMWMFDRVSLIEGTPPGGKVDDPEAEAIEAGANEVESAGENVFSFTGAPEDLKTIETTLRTRGWNITTAELSYKAKNNTELTDAQKKEVIEFIQALDDNDDTHRIHASIEL
ncbi:MAG: YebC/PmpR family DNA-binding transcriptional regulator [Bdellovibrionaceae bacterium]|nr:YebC/PmpR family DNA-binding transcriptional regulator [Pseudobdellovibrionaceae bacterium]